MLESVDLWGELICGITCGLHPAYSKHISKALKKVLPFDKIIRVAISPPAALCGIGSHNSIYTDVS
jgi:hypothetical protein